MAKTTISRPVIYAVVAAVVVYAGVVLTEPEPAPRKAAVRTARTASPAPDGFTEADLNTRFVRYAGRPRDPFSPKVVPAKAPPPAAAPPPAPPGGPPPGTEGSVWTLTGISSINGVRSALIENGSTKESLFLKAGDRWNGLTVAAIEADAVVLRNALGQETRLVFDETAPEPRAGTAGAAASASPAPAAPGAAGSAAAPVAGAPGTIRERNASQP